MVKYVCSIMDVKAEAWLLPMFFQGKGQGVRSFTDVVNDGESQFSSHPEDYVLFVIGEFDERSGIITGYDAPEVLARGVNVKESVNGSE